MVRRGRRETSPGSIQSEQQRLHAIRVAAEQELGRLRTELSERVAAVERRERELADALAKLGRGGKAPPLPVGTDEALTHAQVGLAARAQELSKRDAELTAREKALVRLETDFARRAEKEPEEPEQRLAQIEARLKALQEAEKAFARTQAELATASDELARREAALAERERLVQAGGGAPMPAPGLSKAELADLEDRLRRLEQETRSASTGRTFGDGLRTLERRGLRGSPRPDS